jgi:hypothetical protein
MSIRSGANSDLVLNNLKVNGILTLDTPLEYEDFDVVNLTVSADSTLNNMLATGQCSVNDLRVTGTLDIVQPITYTNLNTENLNATNTSTLNVLRVTGNTALTDLTASGLTTLNDLVVGGTITLPQMTFTDLDLTDLKVSGTTDLNILNATGVSTLSGTLGVTGASTMSTLTTSGLATLHQLDVQTHTQLADVAVTSSTNTGTMSVTGASTLAGTLGVTGASTMSTLTTSGLATLHQLDVQTHTQLADVAVTSSTNTGTMSVTGASTMSTLTTSGLGTLNALTVTGHSQLADTAATNLSTTGTLTVAGTATTHDIIANNVTVNGDLHVSGVIYDSGTPTSSNMEILYFQVKGTASSVTQAITLKLNSSSTTNYSVFPSIYDGYTGGSSGTYTTTMTSGAIKSIVITNRTAANFTFTMEKDTGDSVNAYLVFLVVYNVPNSTYPSTYAS